MFFFFFFKQKTAYEMRISDWSSDVCSSDLAANVARQEPAAGKPRAGVDGGIAIAKKHIGAARRHFPFRTGFNVIAIVVDDAKLDAGAQSAIGRHADIQRIAVRSEERRVGKEWVSTCRSRGAPYQ